MNNETPLWLDFPPVGQVPLPPVVTRKQALPYNDLSWHNFERLIVRLIRLDWTILGCEVYGTPGQEQEGIDILAIGDKTAPGSICFQCKKVEKFDASDIKNAVDKFLDGKWAAQCKEFFLCVSRSLEGNKQVTALNTQRQRLLKQGIMLKVWDGSEAGELSLILKSLPYIVDDFFGRSWVQSFNGAEEAESLGLRLDAIDQGKLRGRLKALYAGLFNQHDPGIRGVSGTINYFHRYVTADVIETSRFAASRSENKKDFSNSLSNEKTDNSQEINAPPISTMYETRRGVFSWINEQKNCVVLGEAGYGKSALLRHLALALLQQDETLAGQLGIEKLTLLPIWISFPAFSAAIERKASTSVQDHFHDWLHQNGFDDVQILFNRCLTHSKLLLLVDGLDEATDLLQAQYALDRIALFATSTKAEVICTSRPLGFNSLGVPSTWTTTNLAALSDEQIRELSARWFILTECEELQGEAESTTKSHSQIRADAFLAAIRSNTRTHQLARIPLLCQTLIELFRNSHRLPEERQAIYEEIISLLLSRHPIARIRAAGVSVSNDGIGFGPRDVREILIRIAWHMQFNGRIVVENVENLERVCANYLIDGVDGLGLNKPTADRNAHDFIVALVSRFGILVEKAPNELGFVHLSIQEYLGAEFVCRKDEADQLKWIEEVWPQPIWRECLVNWFGIQGARGKKTQIGLAVNRIAELGRIGEFERIQALELRAELACADIGLPILEARKIISEVVDGIYKSPFLIHRIRLAKELAVGSLGLSVQTECREIISKLITGRSVHQRSSTLLAFRNWEPSPELKFTLFQGMRDEEFVCRRSAAISMTCVFGESVDVLTELQSMSLYEPRPEVRASALRSLGLQEEWAEYALECATKNLNSTCAELLLECVKTRVLQQRHDYDDLEIMSRIRSTDSIDYWQTEEFYDVLFQGWPAEDSIKKAIISNLETGRWFAHIDGELRYLIRSYPGDDEIAILLSQRLENSGMHFASHPPDLWPELRENFRGHPILVPILREQLTKHYEKFKAIYWHPNNVGAYPVIGDDQARDELINAYPTADGRSARYWISTALMIGWSEDEKVRLTLNKWANANIELSAPLAQHSKYLFSNLSERRAWLERVIADAHDNCVAGALYEYLEQFPDEEGRALIHGRLQSSKLWYYTTTDLESSYAASNPTDSFSLDVIRRSLSELDGPYISKWAAKVGGIPELRSQVLDASVPAPVEVRMSIAATLRERVADYNTLKQLIPNCFAESNGGVRSTILLAFAQAAKGEADTLKEMESILIEELKSVGTFYNLRRRSALAGLVELGAVEHAVKILAQSKSNLIDDLVDRLYPDPVSLNTIVLHWNELRPLLEENGLSTKWPVDDIIFEGFGTLLDRSPDLRGDLDRHLHTSSPKIRADNYYEVLAKKYPRSDMLKSKLIESIEDGHGRAVAGLCSMRLLATQFGSDISVLKLILNVLKKYGLDVDSLEDGFLGYLKFGWKDVESAKLLKDFAPTLDKTKLKLKDKLLISISDGEIDSAANCVKDLLSEPLNNWTYRGEDTQLLLIWAGSEISTEVLKRWSLEDEPTLSITAISLLNDRGKFTAQHIVDIRNRFNKTLQNHSPATDGFDVVFSQNRGWCTSAYLALITDKDS